MSLEDNVSDTAAAIEAGRESIDIERRTGVFDVADIDAGRLPIRLRSDRDGSTDVLVAKDVLEVADARAVRPRRTVGTRVIAELASFIAYVNRQKVDESAIWAEVSTFRLTAVINEDVPNSEDDGPGAAGWRDHRAVYGCPLSPEWTAWRSMDGKAMRQDAFGDWIEQRLEDLSKGAEPGQYPKPVELLKIARDLQVVTKGTYSRQFDPVTGSGHLICKTENEAITSTVIPRAFAIAVPIFQGGDRYAIEARIRMVVQDGQPAFTYNLHRRAETELDAFEGVRKAAAEGTGLPVFAGTP